MKERKIEIEYQFAQLEELSQEEQNLVEKAIAATQNSYANYSHFYVGASCLLEDGSIVIGANQENAAFPSGLCAERTAVFAAQANHPELSIKTIAIAARNANGFLKDPISPMWSLPSGHPRNRRPLQATGTHSSLWHGGHLLLQKHQGPASFLFRRCQYEITTSADR